MLAKTPNLSLHVSYSPIAFFAFIIVGFAAGIFLEVPILSVSEEVLSYSGVAIIGAGSILIFSAQKAVRRIRSKKDGLINFHDGPYAHMRHPTYVGLLLLGLGLSLMLNSAVALLSVVFQYITTSFIVTSEEKLLAEHHGETFREYQKKVPRIF